jgi:hypothetical protein
MQIDNVGVPEFRLVLRYGSIRNKNFCLSRVNFEPQPSARDADRRGGAPGQKETGHETILDGVGVCVCRRGEGTGQETRPQT